MTSPLDSVLIIGFGGPTRPDDVLPFLRRVSQGLGVPEERLIEVAGHYRAVGGRSPYNDLTEKLARALAGWLALAGRPLPVHVGMRNSPPLLAEVIGRMGAAGHRHAAGVILAPHRSEASRDRYVRDVSRALESERAPLQVSYIDPWFEEPGFLEACAARIEEVSGHHRGAWPAILPVIFTAHSIPVMMAERSAYIADLKASCEGVARLLGVSDWEIAYQSRSGDGRTPWLGPDITEALAARAASGTREVVVEAIGFLSDHVEVLYDLDVEAAHQARSLGLTLRRAACVNDHPGFVAALGRGVLKLTLEVSAP
ncbi:MAG TPA: ferrochelatase [Candidatus Polarisedimenticolia bacterium]|jgi:ferrochelatase